LFETRSPTKAIHKPNQKTINPARETRKIVMQIYDALNTKAQALCVPPLTVDGRFAASTYFQRNNWSKALTADRSQKTTARLIGGALGRRFKVGDRGVITCIVSYDDLADDAGCSRSTVIVAVAQLRDGGWLAPATSNGRIANNYTLLMPSNGMTVHTVSNVISDDNAAASEISNGVTVHTPLKNNLQEAVVKKDKEEGAQAPLLSFQTRESNAPNGVTGGSGTVAETTAFDGPILQAPETELDVRLADVNPAGETAYAARLVLNDCLQKHQPETFLNAAFLEMGRGGRRNAGLLIDEAGNVLDEADEIETPPPKARARTFAEAIYGDVR
jgi:hypothetical protein